MSLINMMRKFNRILQGILTEDVSYMDVISELSKDTGSRIQIIDRKGNNLGYTDDGRLSEDEGRLIKDEKADPAVIAELKSISEAVFNLGTGGLRSSYPELSQEMEKGYTSLIPVISINNRLATMIIWSGNKLTENECTVCEYCASICSVIMIRDQKDKEQDDLRERQMVEHALDTLSFSELEAIEHMFMEIDGDEGLVVASKIADRAGITRSVIVNALRKFESAGIIRSRSLGMKGTFIQVLNSKLSDELKRKF